VLDLERTLFDAELAEAEARQLELVSVVFLYKALGGGWPISEEAEADPEADAGGEDSGRRP
jgi:multidrug efflux system outer membrane protein